MRKITEKDQQVLEEKFCTSQEIIEERGYISIHSNNDLSSYAKTYYRLDFPGLLVPSFSLLGEFNRYFYYSRFSSFWDSSSILKDSKQINREVGIRTDDPFVIDCPSTCLHGLGDPTVPIYLSNSPLISDALASRGFCSVAIIQSDYSLPQPTVCLDFLDNSFGSIPLLNRELRIIDAFSEIYDPYPFSKDFLVTKALQPKGALISKIYCPKNIWTSQFGYIRSSQGKLRIEKLPGLENHDPFNDQDFDYKYLVLIAICEQVFESHRLIVSKNPQSTKFHFSTAKVYELIRKLFGVVFDGQLSKSITKEFVSLFLFKLGFTTISGIELGSEEWICSYAKLKTVFEMYEINMPIWNFNK